LLAFSESRGTQGKAGQRLLQAGPKQEVAVRRAREPVCLPPATPHRNCPPHNKVDETCPVWRKNQDRTHGCRRPGERRLGNNGAPLLNVYWLPICNPGMVCCTLRDSNNNKLPRPNHTLWLRRGAQSTLPCILYYCPYGGHIVRCSPSWNGSELARVL
jgi:hypothetical protein